MENVKSIINIRHRANFNKWIEFLDSIGYESKVYNLNSINFNCPQNRERIFMLSVLKSHKSKVNFEFSDLEKIIGDNKQPIKSILTPTNDETLFLNYLLEYEKLGPKIINNSNKRLWQFKNYTKFNSENYLYDPNYSGPTLTASGANSRIKIFTKNKIRKLSAHEALKYMGFDDNDYYLMKKTKLLTEQNIIFLAGNSIVVQVLEEIFKTLKF